MSKTLEKITKTQVRRSTAFYRRLWDNANLVSVPQSLPPTLKSIQTQNKALKGISWKKQKNDNEKKSHVHLIWVTKFFSWIPKKFNNATCSSVWISLKDKTVRSILVYFNCWTLWRDKGYHFMDFITCWSDKSWW